MHRAAILPLLLAMLSPAAVVADTVPEGASVSQATSFIGTAINVADRDRAVRFYTEGLGLTVAATIPLGKGSETILRFPGAASQASLLLMHSTAPDAPGTLNHGNGFSRLVLRVANLEALAARLAALGYTHGRIRDSGQQGYRIMMAQDPDGFRLELVQQSAPKQGN